MSKQTNGEDKVVVITGGGGVLGSVMAHAMAKQGHSVAILDLKEEHAAKVVDDITTAGGTAIGLGCNVLDLQSLQAANQRVKEAFGVCDILINGAGGNHPKGTTSLEYLRPEDLDHAELNTFFDLDPKGVEFVFNLNFLGTLLPTQVFAKEMVANAKKGANIINISSMNAFTPLTKIPAYSGAKAAVSNFTQWLAVHFSKVGIRVNAIAPGFFLTAQNKSLLTHANGELTDRANTILSQTPMGRFGEPEELIGTLLWLCGDGASFVTGIVVPIDGGFSAFSGV